MLEPGHEVVDLELVGLVVPLRDDEVVVEAVR